MNIFVTGSAGFIGSNLVEALLAKGHSVMGMDDFNSYYPSDFKRENIRAFQKHPRFQLVEGDITDRPLVNRSIESFGAEMIIHLAARAGVRASLLDPFLYQKVNVEGTLTLLEAARTHKVRKFTFASTSSVYGLNKKIPFSVEDTLFHPVSPYAATKIGGEALCRSYSHLFGLDVAVLRFFSVYGPRGRPDMAIYQFTHQIAREKPIQVFGDGSSQRDYTYIDDIIQGVVATTEREFGFEIFNLGESETTPLHVMISLIEKSIGKKAIIHRLPDQPGDVPRTFADIEKSTRILQYHPKVKIAKGIPLFVEWFMNHRLPQLA